MYFDIGKHCKIKFDFDKKLILIAIINSAFHLYLKFAEAYY